MKLAQKYRRMLELRRSLTGPPDAAARAQLKQLAREFPGALRELDTLPTEEIEKRLQACETAEEPWMRWMARYHELMRLALQIRAGHDVGDAEFAEKVRSPAHGRLMVTVFDRLAAEEGIDRGTLWDTLFPPRKGRRDYRHG